MAHRSPGADDACCLNVRQMDGDSAEKINDEFSPVLTYRASGVGWQRDDSWRIEGL
jgi:hypothetical protein